MTPRDSQHADGLLPLTGPRKNSAPHAQEPNPRDYGMNGTVNDMGPGRGAMGALAASNTLVVVVKRILEKVIKASEAAVLDITEKLQGMSTLTETQKAALSGALESFYDTEEDDGLKKLLNESATAMMEAAQRGDFAEVDRIASSENYDKARKATKKLHDSLQLVTTSDAALNEYIMPVLVALQFQDNLRQELEGIISCLHSYFLYFAEAGVSEAVAPYADDPSRDFWRSLAKNFTNIEARAIVLRTALGEDSGYEKDVRRAR